jgi:hypothetical protein
MYDLQTKQARSTYTVWSLTTVISSDQTMVVSSYRLHYQATAIGRSSNQ